MASRNSIDAPGESQGQHRHFKVLVGMGGLTECHKLFARNTHRIPERSCHLFDVRERKNIMTRRHGRVSSKHTRRADLLLRLRRTETFLDQLANALDVTEPGMSLVCVPDLRLDAQRA